MSLRKQAKILGISPPYLNLLIDGKRPWRWHLKEHYHELVNITEGYALTVNGVKDKSIARVNGGADGIRTRDPLLAKLRIGRPPVYPGIYQQARLCLRHLTTSLIIHRRCCHNCCQVITARWDNVEGVNSLANRDSPYWG